MQYKSYPMIEEELFNDELEYREQFGVVGHTQEELEEAAEYIHQKQFEGLEESVPFAQTAVAHKLGIPASAVKLAYTSAYVHGCDVIMQYRLVNAIELCSEYNVNPAEFYEFNMYEIGFEVV